MKHKRTPFDLALRVALPMAQTSQIEGRLRMILDNTQSRSSLTRRVLLAAFGVGIAVLVPLAMLHPAARAQEAAPPVSSSLSAMAHQGLAVALAGVTEVTVPGGKWWTADGALLPGPISNTPNSAGPADRPMWFTAKPAQRGLFFVFRLPPAMRGAAIDFQIPDESVSGLSFDVYAPSAGKEQKRRTATVTMTHLVMQERDVCTIAVALPASLPKTSLRLGIAAGSWKPAARVKFHPGAIAYFIESLGSDKYTLDHLQMSKNSVQFSALASGHADRRVIAIDARGRHLPPVETSNNSLGDHDKTTARFALRPAQIKALLIETRPFQWTEFKDVALQPNGSAASSSAISSPSAPDPDAAAARLRQIYGFLQVYRRMHGNAFPATIPPGLMVDMAAHPQRYGLPDRGAGNAAQALHFFTSPDSQFADGGSKASADKFIVYFLHNKRPDGTRVGTAKRAGTRDVFATTHLYVHNHPDGETGFYLVLWDDGAVERIPADRAFAVPAYDVIGDAQEAARERVKQIAFPGQAGLPGS